MVKMKNAKSRNVPWGVKEISGLHYLSAIGLLITGIIFLFRPELVSSSVVPKFLIDIKFVALSIIFILLALLTFFIGRELRKGQKWARIASIVTDLIGITYGLFNIFNGNILLGTLYILLGIIIGGYLLFSKKVREFFNYR